MSVPIVIGLHGWRKQRVSWKHDSSFDNSIDERFTMDSVPNSNFTVIYNCRYWNLPWNPTATKEFFELIIVKGHEFPKCLQVIFVYKIIYDFTRLLVEGSIFKWLLAYSYWSPIVVIKWEIDDTFLSNLSEFPGDITQSKFPTQAGWAGPLQTLMSKHSLSKMEAGM